MHDAHLLNNSRTPVWELIYQEEVNLRSSAQLFPGLVTFVICCYHPSRTACGSKKVFNSTEFVVGKNQGVGNLLVSVPLMLLDPDPSEMKFPSYLRVSFFPESIFCYENKA